MINELCRKGTHCKCEFQTGRCCQCDEPASVCPFVLPTDELKKELAKREEEEFNKRNTPPSFQNNPDLSALEEYARDIVEHVREHGYAPKDCRYYVFEMLMNIMAGSSRQDFWKWWRWRCNG